MVSGSLCTPVSTLDRPTGAVDSGSETAGEREGGRTSKGDDKLGTVPLRDGMLEKPGRAAGESELVGGAMTVERIDGDIINELDVDVGSESAAGGAAPLDCACDAALTAAATDSLAFLRFTSSTMSFNPRRVRLFCHHVLICFSVRDGTAADNAVQSRPCSDSAASSASFSACVQCNTVGRSLSDLASDTEERRAGTR